MKTNSQETNHKFWLSAAIGLALLVVVAIPRTATAQWTTSGNNISNTNTGNVGVGITTPLYKFDVMSGTNMIARFGSTAAANSSVLFNAPAGYNSNLTLQNGGVSKWFLGNRADNNRFSFIESTGTVEVFSILQNGNVGIGTTTPGTLVGGLSLSGTIFQVRSNTSHAQLLLSSVATGFVPDIKMENSTATVTKRVFESLYDGASNVAKWRFANESTGAITQDNVLVLSNTGNVGIGTASPSTLLHVGGGGDSPLVGVSAIYATNAGATNIAVRDSTSDVEGLYYAYSGGVLFGAVTNHNAIIRTNNLDRITVTSGGNVGIGLVPASGNKLDVAGNINASGTINATALNINNSPVTGSQWTTNGTAINYSGGNIGIGATTPQSKLSINTSTQSPGSLLEINSRGDLAAGSWSAIRFGLDSNSYPNQYAKGGIVYESRDGYNRGKLHLVVNTAANTTNMSLSDALLTVDGTTGNVGIGSTTPASKLDVAGNVNATGTISATGLNINGSPVTSSQWATNGSNISYSVTNGNVGIGATPASGNKLDVAGNGHFSGNVTVDGSIAAKYQDMAEWVPSSEHIPTGTVVVLDSTKSNQVISSTQAYDTRVAGVISEQPGIALGEGGAGKVLVATTGRVLVQVDASKSPIHIGDLLVTSDVPGVAMKSEPVNVGGVQLHRPGTLIGKALEPLEKGSGKILVLLSLQ